MCGFFLTLPASASPLEEARIVINVPARTLWLYDGNKMVANYPVGVGRIGFPTPEGHYRITHKIVDPGWENPYLAPHKVDIDPGAQNPLGTRWLGFKAYKGGEYGIHGTDNPKSVGKYSSHGCVRMKVKDAEALFEKVSEGTPVEVTYQCTILRQKAKAIQLIVYPDVFKKGRPSPQKIQEEILRRYPNANVNMLQVKNALGHPTEHPVVVALLEDS